MTKSTQKALAGVGVLALASLVGKVLSALYRVPFQNLVGDTGFYVYQQVYPIYGIAMVMALSGWPAFIAKLLVEQVSPAKQRSLLRRIAVLLVGVGLVCFSGLFFGAEYWAWLLGRDPKLIPEIQAVAWLFLLMPGLAILRGYTQAQLDMHPTAWSQLVEQLVRVSLILGVAFYGRQQGWSVYQIGTWATFAATIAGLGALVVLVPSWRKLRQVPVAQVPPMGWSRLTRRLWSEGMVLTVVAMLMVLLQFIDAVTVKSTLVLAGTPVAVAEQLKGIYDRGQPLLQLGLVVAIGLGTTLLPRLRRHWQAQRWQQLREDFQISIRFALLVAGMMTFGMIAIMPALNQVLFNSRDESLVLAWFVLAIMPATLILVGVSVLQSMDLGTHVGPMLAATLLLKFGLNIALLPQTGLLGAALATILALLPLLVYMVLQLPKGLWGAGFSPKWWCAYVVLLFSVTLSARLGLMIGDAIFGISRLGSLGTMLGAIVIGVTVGLTLLVKLPLLTPKEWLEFPFGPKIYRLVNRK